MAEQRASAEPYRTRFEATVAAVDGEEVTLSETYFYAESGGQPADRGTIDCLAVSDVTLQDGRTVHRLAEEPDLSAGETVLCEIDEGFRTYCMRAHTASHVLYGAARDLLAELGYGGFDIGERKVRIDFETTTDVDDGTLLELERRANLAVWENRPVRWETVSVEEARAREEVAFNTKTEEGVFGEDDGVRIVTVGPAIDGEESWDVAACGGTHVERTVEIGPIAVLGRENPGEGLTRVELAVGPSAIEHRTGITDAALSTAEALGIRVEDLPTRVRGLAAEIDELEAENRSLTGRLIDARLESADPVEIDGDRWLVTSVEGEGDALADRARTMAGERAAAVVLVSGENPVNLTVATTGDVDAGDVIARVTGEFGGGGGGGPEFAQGGGIAASPEEIEGFLRR
ncbi:alanyl-tRNA editing protein [Natronorarus salvus]|uniref:alanyl-tRNA editing protein n=1 Tax=Natronorarus salvus TaxID=3117733 RepID=UPI002F26C3E8